MPALRVLSPGIRFPRVKPQNRVVFLCMSQRIADGSLPRQAPQKREALFIWLCQDGKEWHRISTQCPTKTDGGVWQPRQANNCTRNLICPLFSILSLKNTVRINPKLMESMPKWVLLWKCLFRAICLCLAFLLQHIFLHTLRETTFVSSNLKLFSFEVTSTNVGSREKCSKV